MSELSGTVSARFPDLEGKSAIVTGTSRGIGLAVAEFLGRQGMKVTMASRSAEAGEAIVEGLRAAGLECQWVTADLSQLSEAERVFGAAVERYGAVDVLVNNAASKASKPFLDLTPEAYASSFEDNVRMVYGLSRLAARHMVDRGQGGAIVNISSVGGARAHEGTAGYDASKGAIDALTRVTAVELARHGIRVNAVAPGFTPGADFIRRRADLVRDKLPLIPLHRAGTGDDVAAAVAFLASDAAAYITGQVLYVDGGLMAQLAPPGILI